MPRAAWQRAAAGTVAALAVAGGALLIWQSLPGGDPSPAIAPDRYATPGQAVVGPTAVATAGSAESGRLPLLHPTQVPMGTGVPTTTAAGGQVRKPRLPSEFAASDLALPALEVIAPVVVGGVSDGALLLPEDPVYLTRWTGGADVTATEGTTLIAGHVMYNQNYGSLHRLTDLQPGNVAWISDAAGNRRGFKLQSLVSVRRQALPDDIYNPRGPRRLVVVTCGGEVTQTDQGRVFADNVIATFEPL